MKVISTNLGKRTKVIWKDQEIETGIYKYPVNQALYLGREDVAEDHVVDRRYHGGTDKACYCYSADHYDYWKQRYPDLNWDWGMFGENLTLTGLDESKTFIGDIYELGSAVVQISKPRQPCFKLGIRFGTQQALKDFLEAPYPGTYLKIIQEGEVKVGDEWKQIEHQPEAVSVLEVYQLLFAKEVSDEVVHRALNCAFVTGSQRETIVRRWGTA